MITETILVDTSAWIASFKRTGNAELKEFLRSAVMNSLAATSPVIILEIIQGCRSERERDAMKAHLQQLTVVNIGQTAWEYSYQLAFSLRRSGLTVPTVDTIIAAIALEHECILLHQDRHYELIARHCPLLRTKHFADPSALN